MLRCNGSWSEYLTIKYHFILGKRNVSLDQCVCGDVCWWVYGCGDIWGYMVVDVQFCSDGLLGLL